MINVIFIKRKKIKGNSYKKTFYAILIILFLLFTNFNFTSNILAYDTENDLVFIHHSCGKNWLDNSLHSALLVKDYIDERNDIYYNTDISPDNGRPDSLSPEPGDYTNMNHWVLWFNDYLEGVKDHDCSDGFNQIIMFKSCFPISNIISDGQEPGNPFDAVYPSGQTIVNYKAVYRHPSGPGNNYNYQGYTYKPLEDVFADNPDILFIPVSAPPRHYSPSDATTDAEAHRARVFNNWLKNDWLEDYVDETGLNNVAVFDWFNVLAYPDNHQNHPNRLKSEYGGESGDSHPNSVANSYSTQVFATNTNNFIDSAWNNFFNNPPNLPNNPSPADNSNNVDVNADLSWDCSDPEGDNLTYDVYFEANDPTPDELVSNNQSENWYDPGEMQYSTHHYWRIIAWDENGASTTGPVWDFTTGSEANDPPNSPSDPLPEDGAFDIETDVILSWVCDDPNSGDTITYDVYLEKNDPTPDKQVGVDIDDNYFNPGTLDFESTYYWRIIATDNHGASTPGPVWSFTTIGESEPIIHCEGTLSWNEIKPGATVEGSFIIENIGESGSLLDWEVMEYPSWGDWTFEPDSGENLPAASPITVQVICVAPKKWTSEFNGEIEIINSENLTQTCTVSILLKTAYFRSIIFNSTFLSLMNRLLQRFPLLKFVFLFSIYLRLN